MGIFSSKQARETRLQEIAAQRRLQTRIPLEREINQFHWARVRTPQIQPSQPRAQKLHPLSKLIQTTVTVDLHVIDELTLALGQQPIHEYPLKPYQEKVISERSWAFTSTAALFKKGNKRFFSISKITSVHNIFNTLHYEIAKIKYNTIYGKGCVERFVFHGTKQEFLSEICTYNFDRSKIKAHKYGQGISFAAFPYYATHYHQDNKRKFDKVMIIAKVLVEDTLEIGNQFMTIPNRMGYTSTNPPKSVIVKYDDHAFLPLSIVYYQGLHPPTNSDRIDIYF